MVWNMFKVNNKDNRTTPMAIKFLLFIRLTKKHFILEWETASQIRMCMYITAWKVSVFGVFLVSIFPHSDWIWRDTPYLSVFSPNAERYWPKKRQIRTLFTQCITWKCYRPLAKKYYYQATILFRRIKAVIK